MVTLPQISFAAPVAELAAGIEGARDGVLLLTSVPAAPLPHIRQIFDELKESQHIGNRLNKAYTKNLVYKDSHAAGEGGVEIDMKRVLDLSPERLSRIKATEPALAEMPSDELHLTLAFWERCAAEVMPKLLKAMSTAVGCDVESDAFCNYRMVDYYERPENVSAPRCGEHRDFGTATLVFASDAPGLELSLNDTWHPIPPVPEGSALLLFGWCTQIRSNGRIPAALHRVVDAPAVSGIVPRRTSAVLFIAPKDVETPLEPVVREGEARQYISGVKVGQLRGKVTHSRTQSNARFLTTHSPQHKLNYLTWISFVDTRWHASGVIAKAPLTPPIASWRKRRSALPSWSRKTTWSLALLPSALLPSSHKSAAGWCPYVETEAMPRISHGVGVVVFQCGVNFKSCIGDSVGAPRAPTPCNT